MHLLSDLSTTVARKLCSRRPLIGFLLPVLLLFISLSNRQVHLLSDLLGNADGVLAFREVLASTPALRALMSEAGSGMAAAAAAAASEGILVVDEDKFHLVGEKLGEREGTTQQWSMKVGEVGGKDTGSADNCLLSVSCF